jgi:hypothetical protein
MGADIHLYVERKLRDGTWAMARSYNEISHLSLEGCARLARPKSYFFRVDARDYEFFAALAGVRGPGPEPRGLPHDVSPLVMEEAENWDSDGHSHSWYSAEEFVPLFVKYKMTDKERTDLVTSKLEVSYPTDMAAFVVWTYLNVHVPYKDGKPDISGLRVVFWFDN